jgi:hypothetical protein
MMKTVKEHKIQANDVKEIKVEVIACGDILGVRINRPDSRKRRIFLPYCMAIGRRHGDAVAVQRTRAG